MDTNTPGGAESRATAVEDANHSPAQTRITARRPRTVIMSAGPSRVQSQARVLAHLLKMAEAHLAARAVCQAAAIYFEILEEHSGTQEASRAQERLLEIAGEYEKAGRFHQARSIYERML